jgi:predicted kinase
MSVLIVFSGLPGTGKTTLADHAARVLQVPIFSADQIEAALWRSDVRRDAGSIGATYELLTTLAASQLRLGQSAILDSVAGLERTRQLWRELALKYQAQFRPVECICSDTELHQQRIVGRDRGIPGWYEPTWDDIKGTRSRFEPWRDERLVLDAVQPLQGNLVALNVYVSSKSR